MTTHILSGSLKRPGDHAIIFRKDVSIQGFTALWAGVHTWSVPGVRTCLLWVCYLHLTKLEFYTKEPILVGSELGNSNIKWFISLLSLPNNSIPTHPPHISLYFQDEHFWWLLHLDFQLFPDFWSICTKRINFSLKIKYFYSNVSKKYIFHVIKMLIFNLLYFTFYFKKSWFLL